ncbi:MAG: phosphoribosylaminoimidazolesuccinocarboxamide synthase [Leptospiraceae bacterium]|nr:phosphoribosylaminoimidazolesuccinocarboxamide synthase [Leptospiraceae bacterium]MCP5501491.1 phosphoribosylaminoimidazolesuccinocarboxamide synthase [Leptospiraceae bacterium]
MNPSYRGKVRDVYELGDKLLLCSTDRVSAFDVVFREEVPGKGRVLNSISLLWFDFFNQIPSHIISGDENNFPAPFSSDSYFKGRSVLVHKCKRIDFECVVRGYVSGSAYKEYKKTGTIAGLSYPAGMLESEKLPEAIFTPATKNDSGHDENISELEMEKLVGKKLFEELKQKSIYLYTEAAKKVETAGLILCDTKFEFGILEDKVLLIDEALTPDSSRYWEVSSYRTGISPPSYDKQILRNYLETLSWDKNPPPPPLPEELIQTLQKQYLNLEEKIRICLSEK